MLTLAPDPSDPSIYLCGNSLGLQPRRTRHALSRELSIWSTLAVRGHFDHPLQKPWTTASTSLSPAMSKIVGAEAEEVICMGTLTENIHLLFATFYKPSGKRTKVLIEKKAFPSDHYAVESQLEWHGLGKEHMILAEPEANGLLTTEGICKLIDENKDELAVCFLSGIQYYTGQLFDIPTITAHAQKYGITVGWDLAHAAGNVPLKLHEWGVDFAAWCTYKYLCSGPGGMAGAFVHSKHTQPDAPPLPRLKGWWGHDISSRFQMANEFVPAPGAAGWQVSNPSVINLIALEAALEVYNETDMQTLRQKSLETTGYLEWLLEEEFKGEERVWEIITPRDERQRGAQLSLAFREGVMMKVFKVLEREGVTVDERKPDVIRVAPVPMYNSFGDCWRFVKELKKAVKEVLGQ